MYVGCVKSRCFLFDKRPVICSKCSRAFRLTLIRLMATLDDLAVHFSNMAGMAGTSHCYQGLVNVLFWGF